MVVRLPPPVSSSEDKTRSLELTEASKEKASSDGAAGQSLLNSNVLLCEDSETVATLLKIILERAGANVTTAPNGEEGFAIFTHSRDDFDMIITDMQMPKMDGYALTRRVRDSGWSGEIVALTAFAASEDETKCLSAGCSNYLTKPIDPKSFAHSIAAFLSGTVA